LEVFSARTKRLLRLEHYPSVFYTSTFRLQPLVALGRTTFTGKILFFETLGAVRKDTDSILGSPGVQFLNPVFY